MGIHIIRKNVTVDQIEDMLKALDSYVKLAVDIKREVAVGGGILHADCEAVLLDDGSKQEDVWGADWYPDTDEIRCEALINIRPGQNNRSMKIEDEKIRIKVERIIKKRLSHEKSQ